jgi:hypothetical protein
LRERHYGLILRARADFCDHGDVMADLAESLDDGEVAALVADEQHSSISTIARLALADEDDFLVTEGVGRVL